MKTRTWYWVGGVGAVAVTALLGIAVFRPFAGRTSSAGIREEAWAPGTASPAGQSVGEPAAPGVGTGGGGDALGASGDPTKALPNALRPWVTSAIQGMQAETDPTRHRELLEAAIERIRDGEVGLALAVLTDPEFAKSGRELRQRLFERWGAKDPRAATAWIGRMSAGEAREAAFGDVTRGWASRDLDAARAWALGLPEPTEKDAALISVAYELARTRPVEAMQLAIEMQPTPRRDELLNFSATQWAARAPGEAVEWASQVTDESLRTRLMRDIFTEWGDRDPIAAATAAVKSMPEGREQRDTVVGIVQRWAQNDPKTAASWVSAFPEGELRETAGRELVTIWADQAVEEVGKWLDGLPRGGFRDTAVSAYVGKILPQVPETAADWAMEIGDPGRRAEELEKVGAGWLETDAPAAKAWIAQAPLASEVKGRLLVPPSPP